MLKQICHRFMIRFLTKQKLTKIFIVKFNNNFKAFVKVNFIAFIAFVNILLAIFNSIFYHGIVIN